VPAMAELYRKKGMDTRKVVGVTTLDIVRANKFVGELLQIPPREVDVPVIGGHAGTTILPLFSQAKTPNGIPADKIAYLDKHVQDAGTDVVNAKGGKGSATLSMAYAGARFGGAILRGLAGEPDVVECAYVESDLYANEGLPYFSSKVVLGVTGVERVLPVGSLSGHEQGRLEEAKAALKGEIETGMRYAEANELADRPKK